MDYLLLGLAGKDSLDQALADMYVDGTNDLYQPLTPLFGHLMAGDMEKFVSVTPQRSCM